MAHMATIKWDTTKFKARCDKLGREWGVEAGLILADQMRLLGVWCLKETPPGTSPGDRTRAQRQINTELRKIFQGMTKEGTIAIMARMFNGGKGGKKLSTKLNQQFSGSGAVFDLKGDLSAMRQWHKNFRASDGHVHFRPEKIGEVFKSASGTGKMPVFNKMYVPARALAKYIQQQSAKVGLLMAGWIPGIRRFETITGMKTRGGVPSWLLKVDGLISKRKGDASASNFDTRTGKGYMWISNNVPWNRFLESIVQRGLVVRQKDMMGALSKRLPRMRQIWQAE